MPPFNHGQMAKVKTQDEIKWLVTEVSENRLVDQDTIKAKISAAINSSFVGQGRATADAIRQVATEVGTPLVDVVQAKVAEDYSEVIGRFGRVPAEVVEHICVQHNMKRDVVQMACDRMAADQGQNGVKAFNNKPPISHELKLMRMRGARVYATKMMGVVPYFDKVGNHQ